MAGPAPLVPAKKFVVWLGGRGQHVGRWQEIRTALETYPRELYNNGFESGGYALVKTSSLTDAWSLYDWAQTCGLYTGKKEGPCEASRVFSTCPFPIRCPCFSLLLISFLSICDMFAGKPWRAQGGPPTRGIACEGSKRPLQVLPASRPVG